MKHVDMLAILSEQENFTSQRIWLQELLEGVEFCKKEFVVGTLVRGLYMSIPLQIFMSLEPVIILWDLLRSQVVMKTAFCMLWHLMVIPLNHQLLRQCQIQLKLLLPLLPMFLPVDHRTFLLVNLLISQAVHLLLHPQLFPTLIQS